jgi:hypothetical protein
MAGQGGGVPGHIRGSVAGHGQLHWMLLDGQAAARDRADNEIVLGGHVPGAP